MKLRREFESLLVWYLPVLIISNAAYLTLLPAIEDNLEQYPARTFGLTFYLGIALSRLDHLAAGIWLAVFVRKEKGRFIIWCIAGLATGLWSVVAYLILRLAKLLESDSRPVESESDLEPGAEAAQPS